MLMSSYTVQKRYFQKYRTKWENMDEFKGWLKPFPDDNTKAYCDVCRVVIKAHLCDLRKHGGAKKHINATVLVRTLQKLNKDQDGNIVTDFKVNYETRGIDEEEEEYISGDDASPKWPQEHIELLLKHVKIYWKDLQDRLRKKKDVWEDIAKGVRKDGINVTSQDCNKKFRNMKSRYQYVLKRNLAGEAVTFRIDYFNSLHELLENDPDTLQIIEQEKMKLEGEEVSDEETIIMEEASYDDEDVEWTGTMVHLLLEFLQEFKDFFSGKEEEENEDEVWQNVTEQIQMKGYQVDENQCRNKWQSLVSQFYREKTIAEAEGSLSLWPFYTLVRHIIKNVRLPTGRDMLTDGRPMRVKLKSGRRRVRKAKLSEPTEDSDASETEMSCPYKKNESSRFPKEDPQTLKAVRRLTETATVWNRLDSLEMRLDEMSDQSEIQRQTNSLLKDVLRELSILTEHLSPQSDPLNNERDGITLVVPSSDHSL